LAAEAVGREPRGRILDGYLADQERRNGPVSDRARQWAEEIFDRAFGQEGGRPAAG